MCIVLNQFGYRFRNFIAIKLKRAGLAADSGIPTPQFSRTCPGVGLAFLRNRLTSTAANAQTSSSCCVAGSFVYIRSSGDVDSGILTATEIR